MNKALPDKWVRKAIFTQLNNIVVDGNTIPCKDTRVTGNNIPPHYILMTTQTNSVDKANKCEYFWNSSVLLDITTTYQGAGNTGSRVLADNILDRVRDLTNNLTLDVSSGLEVFIQKQDFPNDLTTITRNENIFRKFMRLELTIK